MFGLSKDNIEDPGLGLLENVLWYPQGDDDSKEPMTTRQVMEATDEEGWFTRNLDWDESEDRVEFKKQMSLKPSMQLPTSRSSVGMKVNIGGKDYLIESPILDQQNNPATQAMKDLNTFLETPENSRALLKLGPNTIVEAVKTDQGFNGDTHNGFNVEFIQHALHYGLRS